MSLCKRPPEPEPVSKYLAMDKSRCKIRGEVFALWSMVTARLAATEASISSHPEGRTRSQAGPRMSSPHPVHHLRGYDAGLNLSLRGCATTTKSQ